MIKLKVRKTKEVINVCSEWSDVTFAQWMDIEKAKGNKRNIVSILTGMPTQMIKRLDDKSLYIINNIISFINVKLELDKYNAPEHIVVKKRANKLSTETVNIPFVKNIRRKTLGQKIMFHKLAQKNHDNLVPHMVSIVMIYSQPYFDGKEFDVSRFAELRPLFEQIKLVDLYAVAMDYMDQLKKIIEREAKELSSHPSNEQIQAGVDKFEQFGVMNTVNALADGDVLKYEDVLRLEYNIAFTKMKMSKTQTEFENNYREVVKRKK